MIKYFKDLLIFLIAIMFHFYLNPDLVSADEDPSRYHRSIPLVYMSESGNVGWVEMDQVVRVHLKDVSLPAEVSYNFPDGKKYIFYTTNDPYKDGWVVFFIPSKLFEERFRHLLRED